MSNKLPHYFIFENHYKRIDVDNEKASSIAGLKKTVANACAVRLCYAFNHIGGHAIPSKPAGVQGNVWAGVKGNYILGSKGFANYMENAYGAPAKHSSAYHKMNYKDSRGLVFFDVRIWRNANGHVSLWDGTKGWRGEFFNEATRIWYWDMPSGPGALVSAYL